MESRLRKSIPDDERAFAVEYSSLEDFKTKAKRFGIFPEWKDGVPRGAYRGVVTFKMLEGRATVHFTPSRMVPIVESYRRLHPAAVIPIPEEEKTPKAHVPLVLR